MSSFDKQGETEFTAMIKEHGAFFAFSNKQFDEQADPGVDKYVSLAGLGLICPKENASKVLEEMDRIVNENIERDKAAHSKEDIIRRELDNHECGYTMDPTDAIEALAGYGYSEEDVLEVFRKSY